MTIVLFNITCNECRHTSDLSHEKLCSHFEASEFKDIEKFLELHSHKFICRKCNSKNISTHIYDSELAKVCSRCHKPIPLARLEAMPNGLHCVTCQVAIEKDEDLKAEEEKCEKCGAEMVWRIRQTVLPVKYFLGCSNYPRCKFVISGSW